MKVKEAMNKGVLTVDPEIKPLDAFEKMYKEGVRRLFVLDDDRNPMGVVSYSDSHRSAGKSKTHQQRYVIHQNI